MNLSFANFKQEKEKRGTAPVYNLAGWEQSITYSELKPPHLNSRFAFCFGLGGGAWLLSRIILPLLVEGMSGLSDIVIVGIWTVYWVTFMRLTARAEKRGASILGLLGIGAIAVFLQPLPLGHLFLILRWYPSMRRCLKLKTTTKYPMDFILRRRQA